MPTPDLIKTPEQLEGIRRAGVVNTGVLDAVEQEICAGMSTLEIDQICRDYCALHGAIPACLNYDIEDGETPPFPMSVCTSINEVVCHGIPKAEDILEEGDIINVKECLEIGMEAAKPWGWVNDIGKAIEKHAKRYHYGVVRDLCGHGVGCAFHEEPEVAHFQQKGNGMLLVPGMVFTIEPMINMGSWKVFIDSEDPYGWEVISDDELPSAQWEHTLLMTEHGVEILSH